MTIYSKLIPLLLACVFSVTAVAEHVPRKIIFKIEPAYLHLCTDTGIAIPEVEELLNGRIQALRRKFPRAVSPVPRAGKRGVELRTIYELTANEGVNLEKMIGELKQSVYIQYAEKRYVDHIVFTPNDPRYGDQTNLQVIDAESAWNIQQGDTNVVIAVVDNGTTLEHPDLRNKIAFNYNDPVNGSDSDGNGYVDDHFGWDFVNDDHIPEHAENNNHGVHVSGIAAAETDNGEGIASLGFKTLYLPVKTGEGSSITYGYEGIVYAADRGARIINCSWGGFSPSAFAQDAVDYAFYNRDALVVAAAGNNGRDAFFYPAAYENVLAVTSVQNNEKPSSFSNYGYWADIAAPGENVLSAVPAGYSTNTGTSMATPLVSAAAALVLAEYPFLSPGQLTARLKAAARPLDEIDETSPRYGKMGVGIVDPAAALQGALTDPWFELAHVRVSDSADDFFTPGDTLRISTSFINYLDTSGEVYVKASAGSDLTPLSDSSFYGIFATSEQKDNADDPFEFIIGQNTSRNQVFVIEFTLFDGSHEQIFRYDLRVHPTYIDVNVNRTVTTATSIGRVGFNKRETDQGMGFVLNESNTLLYEAGIMVGARNNNGDTVVVDVVRNDPENDDRDFEAVTFIERDFTAAQPFYAQNIFSDTAMSDSRNDSLGLLVTQTVTAYDDFGHDQYVFFEYEVKNIGNRTLTHVNIGMLTDWDIANYHRNRSYEMSELRTAVTKSLQTELYGAAQLVEGFGFKSYAIDNINGGEGGLEILDGFDTRKKFHALSTSRPEAGTRENGNDVLQIISSGPYVLSPGDSRSVTFAFFAGNSERDIERLADSAAVRYLGSPITGSEQKIKEAGETVKFWPNPFRETFNVAVDGGEIESITVYDLKGRAISTQRADRGAQVQGFNLAGAAPGIYIVKLKTRSGIYEEKVVKE